jgi:acyl-CoA thioester hydrolase
MTNERQILHRLTLRIYYEDTDFSGAVYHANYLRFMERARTEWVRQTGFDQKAAFEATPPTTFVVRRMAIEYHKPAFMDDVLTVETSLIEARGASLHLDQYVKRGDELLVEAKVLVASLSDGRPTRLPRQILAALPARAARPPIGETRKHLA